MLGFQSPIEKKYKFIRNSKSLSTALKVLLPIALVAMPVIALAANADGGRTTDPAALTVVSKAVVREAYSGSGGMFGNANVPEQDMFLTSSISKLPENVGDEFGITFKLDNQSTYPLNNVSLKSRYLAPSDSSDSVFMKLKTLHKGSWYLASKTYTYDGTLEPEEILMSVSANAQADPNRMITEIGWPYIAVKTTNPRVVDGKAPLSGPGIRSTVERKLSYGGYTTIERFGITAVFDKCPTAAGDKLNITFSLQNGEIDPIYRLRGTSEKFQIKGVNERLTGPNADFVNLYSNVLRDPANQEDTNVLHKFPIIGNSNNNDWTMPYTFRGRENLVALLSSIQVKSPIDKAPVDIDKAPDGFEYGVTRSGAVPLADVCSSIPATTVPASTVPPTTPSTTTVTTVPVSTTVPAPNNGPSIAVTRFLNADGTFKYSVTNNGRETLGGLQLLDVQASDAAFNVVGRIETISTGQTIIIEAKSIPSPKGGFGCQVWYHEKGSPTGIGVPCLVQPDQTHQSGANSNGWKSGNSL